LKDLNDSRETGVTDESLLSGENKSDIVPDYIIQSMGDFAVLAD
jgi:hypothetical protein